MYQLAHIKVFIKGTNSKKVIGPFHSAYISGHQSTAVRCLCCHHAESVEPEWLFLTASAHLKVLEKPWTCPAPQVIWKANLKLITQCHPDWFPPFRWIKQLSCLTGRKQRGRGASAFNLSLKYFPIVLPYEVPLEMIVQMVHGVYRD